MYFTKLNSSYIFPDEVVKDVKKLFTLGEEQYAKFRLTRFILGTEDIISSRITKNLLNLPKTASVVETEKPRIAVNEKLINQLRDAFEFRSELAIKLFQSEWTGIPECFVDKNCNPYHGKKSQLLECLDDDELHSHPKVDAIVVDMSVVTRAQASVIAPGSTFNNLADGVLNYIISLAEDCEANRIDIVLDQYSDLSIKYPTR